jgi:pyruvate kinase
MVARGDLGVEVPIEEIAHTRSKLIAKANLAGKPVITATQMLRVDGREPPAHARRGDRRRQRDPRRDRLRDALRRIRDGQFPEEAVTMLAKIAAFTEAHRPHDTLASEPPAVGATAGSSVG